MQPKKEVDTFVPQLIAVFWDHGADVGESIMQLSVLGPVVRISSLYLTSPTQLSSRMHTAHKNATAFEAVEQ